MNGTPTDGPGQGLDSRLVMGCLEVGKLLTSTLDLEEILRLIVLKMSDLVEAGPWSLLLRDLESGELTFKIIVGVDEACVAGLRIGKGEGIAGYVAESGESLFIEDVRRDPRFCPKVDEMTGFTTRSIVCVPLRSHGRIQGVIEVVNVKDLPLFRSQYLSVLMILADYAAIAIENSRFVARIRQLSITDEYTGLYNARHLHQTLDEMLRQADAQGRPLAVVFMDIDRFKSVVDTYGHVLGSQVLKEVGRTMASCLGPEDLLFKYGGDEYVIVLPGRGKEEARKVVQRILDTIRGATYLDGEARPVKLTASFGISLYPEDARVKKDLLLLADQAMYDVKTTTKNGVGVR